ncbi:hypothetical protein YPPY94_0444, partial [Yersinia pestis PY-94]
MTLGIPLILETAGALAAR